MSSTIRPRKGGGYSECSSPDPLVGKGRCCHIIDGELKVMEIKKIQRGSYEVTIDSSTISIKAQKQSIIDFFTAMPKIDEAKQKQIIDFLEES